ncbi:hypothetical protein KP79_PYT09299 [Mizuhopecten yessoensis]|uniref:Uncharacterized protein n=1 Tax=Mizuhopecten yessoensis TaxID=6573 RepID=A0A210QCD8_MIZYE|nr:hypothetical protein KP79_PYT09299 [Mizuhopecten yessoensis]
MVSSVFLTEKMCDLHMDCLNNENESKCPGGPHRILKTHSRTNYGVVCCLRYSLMLPAEWEDLPEAL